MNNLGVLYENGLGVSQDYKEAARLYELAAAKNQDNALYGLGRLYEIGKGVKRNHKTSADLVFRALKFGNRLSLNEMTKNSNGWSQQFRQ